MRRYASKLLVVAMVLFTITSGEATAVPIPVLFDITTLSGTGFGNTASGTSNGIFWSASSTYISFITVTDGTFGGFNVSGKHIPQIPMTDNFHVSRRDFTLTFFLDLAPPIPVEISSMLVYIGENSSTFAPGLDFGIVPTMFPPLHGG